MDTARAAHPSALVAESHVRRIAHDGGPAPVDRALLELDERLAVLSASLEVLEHRLGPVLRMSEPSPMAGSDPDGPTPPRYDSDVTRRVDAGVAQAARLRDRVEELVARLDV